MREGKRRRSRLRRALARFLVFCFLSVLALFLAGGTALVVILNHYSQGLPDVARLRYYEPSETTRIYAADGTLIATLFKENRTWTPLEKISPNLKNAILAIEDTRFYSHRGVDPIGILRALLANRRGGTKQGASTITMQLARNLFLHPEQTYDRKIREALLALQIEKKFTKDEILELYLNQIYFGSGAYGVQAAASTYFAKKASDLTVAEAAVIAGLPAAPSEYSPLVDRAAARERARVVLRRMADLGMLDGAQLREALNSLNHLKYNRPVSEDFRILKVPYFTTYVLSELYSRYDEDLLFRGGLKIYTTVDLKLQEKAEEILRRRITADRDYYNVTNGALVCIENKTGYIRAMVGGLGWSKKNQFNRAYQAKRQPGSAMKIFVYTAAIEAGFTPDTVVPDTPVSYTLGPGDVFTPKNSDGGFMGAIPLRTALAQSRNVVAVKLLTMVGPERVIEYAYRMGIKEKLEPVLSLALGACVVSPLEMASAVSVLANGGIRTEPTAIKMIRDSEGNIVEDHTYPRQEEVLSESTAYTMCEMLRGCVEHGTGTAAAIPGRQVAGKTGTTNDHRDAWFVGFTPQYSTAVWVGNDDYSRMWGAFGGTCAAPIWHDFMVYAHRNLPALAFGTTKGGMVSVLMCSESKKRAGARCPTTYKEFFRPGQVPMAFCDRHGRSPVPVVAGASGHKSKPSTGQKPAEEQPEEVSGEAPAEIPTPVWMTRPVEVEVQPPGGPPPAAGGSGEPAAVAPVEPVEAAPVEIPQATPEQGPAVPPAEETPEF